MSSTSILETTTRATLEEKKKLRKELNFFDMIFFTISALIGLDTLGPFSSNGEQALTWLVIAAISYFLPYGLITAEIGSTFTQEGGMYEWCKLAEGRFFAAIGAMLYWISNPLWVGGTLSVEAIAAIKLLWFGSLNFKFGGSTVSDTVIEMVIAIIFIWGTIWCAIISLRYGKWLSVVGSYVKLTLLALFIILSLLFIFSGQSHGTNLNPANLVPSNFGLIVSVILPVIIFQFTGFELQNGAGEEMHSPQRDVPRSLVRSGVITVIAYVGFLLFILLALPKSQLTNVGSFISAYQTVGNVLGPLATPLYWIIGLAFVIALASNGGTWVIGTDRTYAISSLDGTAPKFLGRFSKKFGTPIFVNTLSGIIATVTVVTAILITELNVPGGQLVALFTVVIGFALSTNTLSFLLIFPAFLILRYKYPNLRRPYRVPGGMIVAWVVTLFPFAYVAICSFFILFPLNITINGIDRNTYIVTQLVALGIILLLAIIFFVLGQKDKRNQDVVVEVNLADDVELATAGRYGGLQIPASRLVITSKQRSPVRASSTGFPQHNKQRSFLEKENQSESILSSSNQLRLSQSANINSSNVYMRIMEEPLTARNVSIVVSALTELNTKYWLIAQGRFADLIEYSQSSNARFDEESKLVISKLTHNSPAEIILNVSLEGVADALKTTIDAVNQAGERKKEAELKNTKLEEEIEQTKLEIQSTLADKEQARQLEKQKNLLDLYDKQLELKRKQLELVGYIFDLAPRIIDMLYPNADANTKAMAAKTLIKNFLELDTSKGLELALPQSLEAEKKVGDK